MKPSTASSSLAPMPTDDPSLPDWMADLTPDKLLEQCRRLKTNWPLPDIGGVFNESQKIRELKAGLAILRIDSPVTPELHDGLVERLKNGSTAKNRKLFDDFHASVDLIVAAIRNAQSAAPSSDAKPVDDEAAKAAQYAALLVSVKSLANDRLVGKQRRVVELLVEAGGRKRIADVATDAGVGWDKPYKTGVDGFKKLIKEKLTSLGAAIIVVDQELRILLADDVPQPRRQSRKISTRKARPPKKTAPPKRRQ